MASFLRRTLLSLAVVSSSSMCAFGMLPGSSGTPGGGPNFGNNSSNDPRIGIGAPPTSSSSNSGSNFIAMNSVGNNFSGRNRPRVENYRIGVVIREVRASNEWIERIRTLLSEYSRDHDIDIRDLQISVTGLFLSRNILGQEEGNPVVRRAVGIMIKKFGKNWRSKVSNDYPLVTLTNRIVECAESRHSVIDILDILCPNQLEEAESGNEEVKAQNSNDDKNNVKKSDSRWWLCSIF